MNADVIQEKTAVFSFGSLSRTEEPRLYDLDEPTRELPLIAGRFAGREWSAEELRRELREKDAPQGREMRRRRAVTLLTGALCAMLLLVVSMLGQACFSSRSAAGRPAAENVIVFSQKETVPAAAVHGSAGRAGLMFRTGGPPYRDVGGFALHCCPFAGTGGGHWQSCWFPLC